MHSHVAAVTAAVTNDLQPLVALRHGLRNTVAVAPKGGAQREGGLSARQEQLLELDFAEAQAVIVAFQGLGAAAALRPPRGVRLSAAAARQLHEVRCPGCG